MDLNGGSVGVDGDARRAVDLSWVRHLRAEEHSFVGEAQGN